MPPLHNFPTSSQGHSYSLLTKPQKLWFSPVHAWQKLKTAPLSLPASLPPSSWSAGFYCLLQRSPRTPGLGASLLSQLWTQQLLLSVLPMGLRNPSPSCCPVLSSLPGTCSPLGHVLPGHSCRISNLPPKCLESMWVSSLNRNSITSTSFVRDAS